MARAMTYDADRVSEAGKSKQEQAREWEGPMAQLLYLM